MTTTVTATVHVYQNAVEDAFSVQRTTDNDQPDQYWLRCGGLGCVTIICSIHQLEHLHATLDALLQDRSRAEDKDGPPDAIESMWPDKEMASIWSEDDDDAHANDSGNRGLMTELP